MSKHQLTISPDYVKDWGYVQAVRELFQNALDNETIKPENKMFFEYKDGKLVIGNKTSILTLDTLLLGSSSKRDDSRTIGKHGEGYKVALMVLLREGKQVTIYNYGAKEVWNTRLIKSRKYNGAMITEIDVDKKHFWQSVPTNSLTIEVEGVTEEEYNEIVATNLHLQDYPEHLVSKNGEKVYGNIITDPEYKGKIFINGLHVCDNNKFSYGYDIKPEYISLDRDRKLIDSFNLSWVTSKLWRYVGKEELVADMLFVKIYDVEYIKERGDSFATSEKSIDDNIAKSIKNKFAEEYGDKSIAVSENDDLDKVRKSAHGVKPVLVSSRVTSYLKEVKDENKSVYIPKSTREVLEDWLEGVKHKLSEEEVSDFEIILDEMN